MLYCCKLALFSSNLFRTGLIQSNNQFAISKGMNSNPKSHRRNKAFQQNQVYYQQRVGRTESPRSSFECGYQVPTIFRASDITCLSSQFSTAKTSSFPKQPDYHNQKCQSSLLSTLHDLEEKLLLAKKQLKIKSNHLQSGHSQDLSSLDQSSTFMHKQVDDTVIVQTQESTINLQSQQKLKESIQDKLKDRWGNKIKTYYIGEIIKAMAGINERAFEHLSITWDILKTCPLYNLPSYKIIKRNNVILPLSPSNEGKKTLVIDLDQTLIHYEQQRISSDDIQIEMQSEGQIIKAYISIRPYAISFLKRARKYFEIIAFTASERSYADIILNEIDIDRTLINHRLYREHCVKLANSIYAKDLKIINRQLSQMIIVDNSPISYLYQLDNGVPILPYVGGEDVQLLHLEKYLQQVRKQRDVRVLNRATFKLWRYREFRDCEQLVRGLYCEDNGNY